MSYNHLGRAIVSSGNEAEYDTAVKELLADKQILAWILKWTTEEFKDLEIDEIIPCIEPPSVSEIPVYPGLTNEAIMGMKNESKTKDEGFITYDVRFNAIVPGDINKKPIRIIIDVEAQKSPYPGYDLISRGVFYGGRMLSDQMDRNFNGKDYDKIEKVYSIWIVFNCPQKDANTTLDYTFNQRVIYGDVELAHRYNLKTKEIEGRIREMCNLSEAITEDAMKKGISQGKAEAYFSMVRDGDIDETKAAKKLSLSLDQFRDAYKKWLALQEETAVV